MSGNMIVLDGTPRLRTAVTDGTVNPGHLVGVLATGKVAAQALDGTVPKLFCVNQVSTSVTYHVATTGDTVKARVAAAATAIVAGNLLVSAGDGTLKLFSNAGVTDIAGTLTGTTDGTIVDIVATAGSCAGTSSPSAANVDTAIATAVASIVTGTNTQLKELQTKLNAILPEASQYPIAMALESVDNSGGGSEAYIKVLVL